MRDVADEKYLVIDASTPLVQCGFSYFGNSPKEVLYARDNVVESLQNLVNKLMFDETFENLEGIIYCYGPGSTLGLRSCVTMINVWLKLWLNPLSLFCYSSLDMAASLINFQQPVTVSIGNGGYLTYTLDKKYVYNDYILSESLFLQTRRIKENCPNLLIDYDIKNYNDSFFSIAKKVSTSELFSVQEKEFTKWDCQRHSFKKV